VTGETERFACHLLGDTLDLVENAARLDNGNPDFWTTLTFTHPGLSWLLGERLVWENPNPNLTTTLNVTGKGDTAGFNLTRCQPAALGCLESEVAEADLAAPVCKPPHLALLDLAMLDTLGHEHLNTPYTSEVDSEAN
jgi:hypothetical protein